MVEVANLGEKEQDGKSGDDPGNARYECEEEEGQPRGQQEPPGVSHNIVVQIKVNGGTDGRVGLDGRVQEVGAEHLAIFAGSECVKDEREEVGDGKNRQKDLEYCAAHATSALGTGLLHHAKVHAISIEKV